MFCHFGPYFLWSYLHYLVVHYSVLVLTDFRNWNEPLWCTHSKLEGTTVSGLIRGVWSPWLSNPWSVWETCWDGGYYGHLSNWNVVERPPLLELDLNLATVKSAEPHFLSAPDWTSHWTGGAGIVCSLRPLLLPSAKHLLSALMVHIELTCDSLQASCRWGFISWSRLPPVSAEQLCYLILRSSSLRV